MKYSKQEVTKARAMLLTLLKPGDTIYTVLKHVSRSGMQRSISLYVIVDGRPRWLDGYARKLSPAGATFDEQRECLKVTGAGMDMGFALVYDLAATLFPQGYCDGDATRSRPAHVPHSANGPACTYQDGGYALKHRWM